MWDLRGSLLTLFEKVDAGNQEKDMRTQALKKFIINFVAENEKCFADTGKAAVCRLRTNSLTMKIYLS